MKREEGEKGFCIWIGVKGEEKRIWVRVFFIKESGEVALASHGDGRG